MTEHVEIRPRCVYVDGKPLQGVRILLVHEDIIRVVVIIGCEEFYAFHLKSDAKEFIKKKVGIEDFEIRPCPK
jgi:hypothetical protein